MRKLEWSAVVWLAAFLIPQALGFSVRVAAVWTVLAMALSAPAVLLGVEELTKGTQRDDETGPGAAGGVEAGTTGAGEVPAAGSEGSTGGDHRPEA